MEYLTSMHAQAAVFLKTVGFGFLWGIGYDLLRLLRRITVPDRSAAPWDIAFGAASAYITFLYGLTQNGGRVRVHLLAAQCLGFLVWTTAAGVPFRRTVSRSLRRFDRLRGRLSVRTARIAAAWSSKTQNMKERFKQEIKKVVKRSKKNQNPS
ncbi:MAG: spore cortex biosynthesis protein YabQ [Clostridia bacterium]|nr:spore cortex biosynthesis protein YabQ [Clostridia bacterium]